MGIQLRPVSADEFSEFHRTEGIPFGFDPTPDLTERYRKASELERLRAAFDGAQMVATFGAFSLLLTVPGGTASMAGTTAVTVLPTHRRRGILRRLMTEHLTEVHERGEPLAGLWASESSIYGRFGYGPASDRVIMRLPKPYAHLQHPVDIHGTMHLVDECEALATFPSIFNTVAHQQPGMYARDPGWWKYRILEEPEALRQGATANRLVLHTQDGKPSGYVIYRTKHNPEAETTDVQVLELIGLAPEAEKALWQFVFGIDLISTIHAWNRPVADPLCWWLEQPRRMQRRIEDALWIRPVNVLEALNHRRYAAAGHLVFRMVDEVCPWNEGVYRLDADADGKGECRRVNASPACELTPFTLGAAYLGGHRFADLARAGLVVGHANDLRQADAMFAWEPRPWCHEIF